ncbi:type II secretion system F family protein [Halobacillus sp. H74]|uniref:type II secretion system F family protein n=1 Tax=Halobacillus sp. H74 TaxID=3457436 RepID=UPI003FCE84D2
MPSDSLRNMKSIRFREPPLSVKHQITFFQRLSHILGKGYPLLDALKMTGWDVALKPTTEAVARSLSKGDTLDAACEKARFSSTVTQFLYFSHIHNDLPKTLKQCKDLLQMKKDYKQRFFQVIRYPLFLFIFLVIAFLILQQTVMPNFVLLFEGQENKAPWTYGFDDTCSQRNRNMQYHPLPKSDVPQVYLTPYDITKKAFFLPPCPTGEVLSVLLSIVPFHHTPLFFIAGRLDFKRVDGADEKP